MVLNTAAELCTTDNPQDFQVGSAVQSKPGEYATLGDTNKDQPKANRVYLGILPRKMLRADTELQLSDNAHTYSQFYSAGGRLKKTSRWIQIRFCPYAELGIIRPHGHWWKSSSRNFAPIAPPAVQDTWQQIYHSSHAHMHPTHKLYALLT